MQNQACHTAERLAFQIYLGSFVHMNQALCASLTKSTQSTFLGLCLHMFRQAGPPQRVEY